MIRSFNAVVTFAILSLLTFGCDNKPTATNTPGGAAVDPGKKIRIAILPKQKGIPYFSSVNDGAQAAAKELGNVEVIYDGPTDGSAEKAAAMIEGWTLKGVDVIAVSPNDPQALAPAMKKARDKGIKVITFDADGTLESRELFVNQATSEQIGNALVDTMATDLGGKDAQGDVAIVTASMTAANQNEWIKAMQARLPTYAGLKLVDIKPSNNDQKLAFTTTQDLMKAYPNLKGVWAISSVAFPGGAEAIQQAGKKGQVLVTGLATPNDMKAFVKDGTVKSVILWNTQDLGYLTVQVGNALARGTLKPGAATFTAGKLGEKKLAGDAVLLGDILVFTKDNIDKFDF